MNKMVYFLRCESSPSFIKIGASVDAAKRQATISSSLPFRITFLAETDGGHCLESALHRHFAEYCVRGEWFQDCQPIRSVIQNVLNGTFDSSTFVRRELTDYAGLRHRYFDLRRGPLILDGRSYAIPDATATKRMPPHMVATWIERLSRFIDAAEQARAA